MTRNQMESKNQFCTLTNKTGMSVEFSNYGALIGKIYVRDKEGKQVPVTLSLPEVSAYEKQNYYLGAMMGRYAGRIPYGEFILNGKKYDIIKNNGLHTLHGGHGLDRRMWDMETFSDEQGQEVIFSILSPDGDSGFPGNLQIKVVYKLYNDLNDLEVWIQAKSDQTTQINLAQHSYFNLNGIHSKIDNHYITIASDCHSKVDSELMPLGGWESFEPRMLNEKGCFEYKPIDTIWTEVPFEMDHTLLLNKSMVSHARAWSPISGIQLDVKTTQPTLHIYTGNFLPDGDAYFNSLGISRKSGFCFETMRVPNTKEFADYPSTVLEKGQLFDEKTRFEFRIVDHYNSFL